MLCTINLDALRKGNYELWILVSIQAKRDEGTVKIDLQEPLLSRVVGWAKAETEEQIDVDADLKADLQRSAARASGIARLHQYQREQGLRDCKENADAIRDWLDRNAKGYISAAGVDAAVANLGARGTNVLIWDAAAPAAPPSQPKAEVLRTLKDGTQQLPLDTQPSRKHSKEQLLDLNRRRREATNQMSIGKGASQNRLAIKF